MVSVRTDGSVLVGTGVIILAKVFLIKESSTSAGA